MTVTIATPVFAARTETFGALARPGMRAVPMDENAAEGAPAPTAVVDAKPAAVQRATPRADEAPNHRDAVKFMAERRKAREAAALTLVPNDAPDADQPDVDPLVAGAPDEVDDGEAEPEKVPTWAAKLKADVAKKTETLQRVEAERANDNARFEAAHRSVQYAHEDLQADIKAEQAYSTLLEQMIVKSGFMIPESQKKEMLAARQIDALKRQLARGQTDTQKQGHEKAGAAAIGTLDALRKKLPELDWEKVPEAKAWLEGRFALDKDGKPVNPGAMRTIDADAVAFAKALRWDRSQKAAASKQQGQRPPNESQRPSASTLSGAGQSAGAKRAPAVPQNEKESIAFMANRRAARK